MLQKALYPKQKENIQNLMKKLMDKHEKNSERRGRR